MLNRFFRSALDSGRRTATVSAALAMALRSTVSGIMTTAHHALMIVGIGAIAALGLMFVKPDITDRLKALSPFTVANAQEPVVAETPLASLMDSPRQRFTATPPTADAEALADTLLANQRAQAANVSREQQSVTYWISRRYHVASDATNMLVSAAYKTADEIKLDPLLILAVVGIESGFNPFAESAVGAQGLMQVMSKIHHEKFQNLGGVKAALNPVANIKVGSLILKDYVNRGGSLEAGLKLYVGAAAFESDSGYGARVLSEYRRLQEVASGKNVPIMSVTAAAKVQPKLQDTDHATEQKPAEPVEEKSAAIDPQQHPTAKTGQLVAL